MSSPYILGFYGPSNSGKTTLIRSLVQKLTEKNYAVAVVKQSDTSHQIDTVGKDTWQHAQAGAAVVVFSTPQETDYLLKTAQSISDITFQLMSMQHLDVILLEGATDEGIPKIQLGEGPPRSNTLFTYQGDEEGLLRFIIKNMEEKQTDETLTIQINGKKIPLTEFPTTIIQSTLLGMVQSLKGVRHVETLTIQLKKEKKGQ